MHLTKLTPMIQVENVSATVEYYVNTIGFSIVNHLTDWSWALLKLDEIELMFTPPNPHMSFEKTLFTGSFYFNCTNVNGWWDRLQHCEIVYPIENFKYGMREFAVRDCNGFVLQFGEELQL
ncbi:MAG TPA: VOC family protein [Flavitalea sp.]|nr:VOC family protein [Flavitalea sp.]